MQQSFDVLIDSYMENRVGLDTLFLSEDLSAGLRENIRQLQEDNLMIAAGTGNYENRNMDQQMRRDQIYWMDKDHSNKHEQEFLQLAEDFISHLNRTCYTGINSYEFHYAVYDKGGFYKRHRDQFQNNSHRKFSLISYLNNQWQEEDGGQLLLYQEEMVQKIQPRSQTAVFFKSDEMEHEVTEAKRQRMSITGWLKRI